MHRDLSSPAPAQPPLYALAAQASFDALFEAIRNCNMPSAAADGARQDVANIKDSHAAILALAGLAIVEGPDAHALLRVESPKTFSTFLGSLSRTEVSNGNLAQHLSSIPSLLASDVRAIRDLDDPGTATLNLLASLRPIVSAYRALGLTDACADLHVYADMLSEKLLPEYLRVERLGYLSAPGQGFAPGDKKFDLYPSRVEERWTEAVRVLEELGKKETAATLQGLVARNLEAIVSAARENISKALFKRRDELSDTLAGAHRSLLPLCTSTGTVHAEDADRLKEALAVLQYRTAPPHLISNRDLYFKELHLDDRIAANLTRNRDGKLLAHACACPAHIPGEADVTTFAVDPSVTGIGAEELILTELEGALRKMGYSAMRLTLPQDDSALRSVSRHFGERASAVGSFLDNVVLRIDLTETA